MNPAHVSVSLGSNINRETNIRLAIAKLKQIFVDLDISPVYETTAVGFKGDDFLNLVVCFHTQQSVQEVAAILKNVEDQIGRDRSQPKFSARKIDLDILTYDDLVMNEAGIQVPREEILQNAFVLKPMSDLMGAWRHPVAEKTYAELWREMEPKSSGIAQFELELD